MLLVLTISSCLSSNHFVCTLYQSNIPVLQDNMHSGATALSSSLTQRKLVHKMILTGANIFTAGLPPQRQWKSHPVDVIFIFSWCCYAALKQQCYIKFWGSRHDSVVPGLTFSRQDVNANHWNTSITMYSSLLVSFQNIHSRTLYLKCIHPLWFLLEPSNATLILII